MVIKSIRDILDIPDPNVRARTISETLAQQQALLAELARLRRQSIAELRASGLTQAQVAQVLGVTPGRVAQLEPHAAAPAQPAEVLVERAIPTDPAVRASSSLFLSEADTQAVQPRRQMLTVGTVPAPAHIALRMGIAEGDPVVVRSKLMFANDVPVRIATSYFPHELAEGTALMQPDFVEGGLQVLLEDLGRHFGRAEETLTARMPSPEEARMLRLAEDVPVVHVLRTAYDTDEKAVHTLETICAADRHVFVVRQVEGDTAF